MRRLQNNFVFFSRIIWSRTVVTREKCKERRRKGRHIGNRDITYTYCECLTCNTSVQSKRHQGTGFDVALAANNTRSGLSDPLFIKLRHTTRFTDGSLPSSVHPSRQTALLGEKASEKKPGSKHYHCSKKKPGPSSTTAEGNSASNSNRRFSS